ncbi:hypothetical protein C7444_103295 [Sphaerotilus hippei]|uniref:Uncharacterized protein n=1 Tax=Sphaerotilus hippei TaxID=744406 RepID=A0A318H3Q8_9BURK|nr:hypothetical protein [Sphaerotilus hippei]PXW98197.1 hypothetical protein C7444_103295 [Sphaerotilus hippei]
MNRFRDPSTPSSPGGLSEGKTGIAELAAPRHAASSMGDLGRPSGEHTRELFVSCDPASALIQHFELHPATYVALHDLACNASRRLLQALAGATGQPIEHLVIRRQGFGTLLASIDYLDCPAAHGRVLRLYCCDTDTDPATRQAVSHVLLGRSTLGVVMVGELSAQALNDLLQPLRDHLFDPHWTCRQLQFMPLASATSTSLATLAGGLGAGSGVTTRIAPLVVGSSEAWSFLARAWNQWQLQQYPLAQALLLEPFRPARESSQPMPLPVGSATTGAAPLVSAPAALTTTSAPLPASPPAPALPRNAPMSRFVRELADLPGVHALCVFEQASSKVVATTPDEPRAVDLARRGTLLMAAAATSRRSLHISSEPSELVIAGGSLSQGLRLITSQPGLAVHLLFDPAVTDWPTLRARLAAMDAALPRYTPT